MRRIFRTRRPTNFKLGRRTEPTFAKVTILIFYLEQPSATNQNTQQHEASHGLSAIAELLVQSLCVECVQWCDTVFRRLTTRLRQTTQHTDQLNASSNCLVCCRRKVNDMRFVFILHHSKHDPKPNSQQCSYTSGLLLRNTRLSVGFFIHGFYFVVLFGQYRWFRVVVLQRTWFFRIVYRRCNVHFYIVVMLTGERTSVLRCFLLL